MIAQDLQAYLVSTAAEQRISDVRIGARYTAVLLEDGNVGVAYTFRECNSDTPPSLADDRALVGKRTGEGLSYLVSSEGLERTVGLAVANALINQRGGGYYEADLLHVLSVGFRDRVGMVGYFGPFIAPLEARVQELLVFERNLDRAEQVLPADAAYSELPRCDVAIITSTALIFGDAERLLEAAANCREIALVGPSTPLAAPVFAPYGVTLLSGVAVVDGPGMLQVVGEGRGTGAFGDRVRKVNIRP